MTASTILGSTTSTSVNIVKNAVTAVLPWVFGYLALDMTLTMGGIMWSRWLGAKKHEETVQQTVAQPYKENDLYDEDIIDRESPAAGDEPF